MNGIHRRRGNLEHSSVETVNKRPAKNKTYGPEQ